MIPGYCPKDTPFQAFFTPGAFIFIEGNSSTRTGQESFFRTEMNTRGILACPTHPHRKTSFNPPD